MPAAPGLGMPMKNRLSAVGSMVVLNRASRIAAQATQRKHTSHPSQSNWSRPRENRVKATSAGARPKLTRSESESYCTPNSLCVPVSRATRPSMPSSSAATNTAMDASSKRPPMPASIA